MTTYTHLPLNEDIDAVAGHYTPQKEARLRYDGREVLYVISEAVVDSSCCGVTDFRAALVPGYIVRWQSGKNGDGLPLSEIEPITDPAVKARVRKAIRGTEHVIQVEFW